MLSRLVAFSLGFLLVLGCAQTVTKDEMARAVEGYIVDVNKLAVVDCLLPGQVRKLGSTMTYLSQRRPVRTTEADCEVRGGEYVAYDRANYTSALNVWLARAQEGDAKAQLYVGQIFEKGLGRPADYREAASWYRKAAEQGDSQAQISLGALYERGLGVQKDAQAALEWFSKGTGLNVAGIPYDATIANLPGSSRDGNQSGPGFTYKESPGSSSGPANSRSEGEADMRLRRQLDEAQSQLILQQEQLLKVQTDLARLKADDQSTIPASTHQDIQFEKSLEEKERVLAQRESEIQALKKQLDAKKRELQNTAGANSEIADVRRALVESESRYQAKQEALQQMQRELESMRLKVQSTPPSSGPHDQEQIMALKREIQEKDRLLHLQQGRIRDAVAQLKREQQPSKKPASVQSQDSGSADAREIAAQLETTLSGLTERFNSDSAELTRWLTGQNSPPDAAFRDKVDQRKTHLQQLSLEIKEVKAKLAHANERLAQLNLNGTTASGPRIEIIEPETVATRGMRSIRVGDSKVLKGRIYPAQLKSLEFNQQKLSVDPSGIFSVPVDPQNTKTIEIKAVDLKGAESVVKLSLMDIEVGSPAEGSVGGLGQGAPISGSGVQFGRFYALIIGNNQYQKYPALSTPVNDAKSIDSVLRERYGFTTKVISNGNRHDIMTALNEFQAKMTENDNFIIYYAGHGEIDPKTKEAFWLPVDAEVGNPANWIASKAITDLLSIMPARHIMVISDSCYSGAMSSAAVAKLPPQLDAEKREKWLKVMALRKSRTLLASGDVRPVLDTGGDGHSVFAQSLLKVLRSYRGVLEDYEIFRAVSGDVSQAAARLGFKQTPSYAPLQYAGHEGSPFIFKPKG